MKRKRFDKELNYGKKILANITIEPTIFLHNLADKLGEGKDSILSFPYHIIHVLFSKL